MSIKKRIAGWILTVLILLSFTSCGLIVKTDMAGKLPSTPSDSTHVEQETEAPPEKKIYTR